jgi:hypothetical protein
VQGNFNSDQVYPVQTVFPEGFHFSTMCSSGLFVAHTTLTSTVLVRLLPNTSYVLSWSTLNNLPGCQHPGPYLIQENGSHYSPIQTGLYDHNVHL